MSSVSIFGLGAMGTAMAARFLEKNFKVTVWNRTPEKANKLLDKGASVSNTVLDGINASDLIIVCLLDNAAVQTTFDQALEHVRGKTVINLTNGTPKQARKLSELFVSHGSQYVHGGIMATPSMIGSPHALILYSGSKDAYNTTESTLSLLAKGWFLGDDAGVASLHDLALLSGMYGLFSGFFHATALVQSSTPATKFLDLLLPWLGAMTEYLKAMAQQVDDGKYSSEGSNMAMQLVAIQNIADASADQGVSADFIHPMRDFVQRAVDAGHGSDDISALISFMKS
ncbi:NAD(P)-dependent oxidoreductase [Aspergillus clavatus NRRL 1]|uniref:Oxidoreductase, putative n=1 Tax=Aspergillus clavatus (strain ATCC 1007 / CBS 513.65 / DSM 816 / NCTC 3887 / NRRL 1 / QM 1276 / 107) TaxID=344612 RepID=A1C5M1_ASPCL|nr:oxidoreductase, putative [Aspergillus clavatus NRRL 1]EAW14989.1 oxidoreductase, putative [Aspergillus clavatus NRRL 1]